MERMRWSEIKKAYPHQYVGLKDVKYINDDGVSVESGVVFCTESTMDEEEMIRLAMDGKIVRRYFTRGYAGNGNTVMVKHLIGDISSEKITVEDDLDVMPEEVVEALTGVIKEIYCDNTHLATMTEYDYYEYPKLLGNTVETAAKELYKDKEELLRKNPGSSIPDIIGYILSERLFEIERQLNMMSQKEQSPSTPLINNNALRKMLIKVDADKISERSAKKLNMMLSYFKMELTEDGWYTGTYGHCMSTMSLILQDKDIFDCLIEWIFWNPDNNSKEDCIEEHKRFLLKWGE